MKAQLILLFLLASVVSTEAYASKNDPKQEEKKTTKSKYDFNIFKLYSFVVQQNTTDSLNVNIKALPLQRKED